MRSLDQEAALPYREFRLSPDREDVVLELFDCVAVPRSKVCGRGPLLPIEADELALVIADWAGLRDRRLLDTTGNADSHRANWRRTNPPATTVVETVIAKISVKDRMGALSSSQMIGLHRQSISSTLFSTKLLGAWYLTIDPG
jgi:hypothetical protein